MTEDKRKKANDLKNDIHTNEIIIKWSKEDGFNIGFGVVPGSYIPVPKELNNQLKQLLIDYSKKKIIELQDEFNEL